MEEKTIALYCWREHYYQVDLANASISHDMLAQVLRIQCDSWSITYCAASPMRSTIPSQTACVPCSDLYTSSAGLIMETPMDPPPGTGKIRSFSTNQHELHVLHLHFRTRTVGRLSPRVASHYFVGMHEK